MSQPEMKVERSPLDWTTEIVSAIFFMGGVGSCICFNLFFDDNKPILEFSNPGNGLTIINILSLLMFIGLSFLQKKPQSFYLSPTPNKNQSQTFLKSIFRYLGTTKLILTGIASYISVIILMNKIFDLEITNLFRYGLLTLTLLFITVEISYFLKFKKNL
ncbi:MAG: hypothetical protein ACEPOW_09885 [Bacteroidales bacterium]